MLLILLVILLLLAGGFGGSYGYRTYGPQYGAGIGLGTILIIIALVWILGGFHGRL